MLKHNSFRVSTCVLYIFVDRRSKLDKETSTKQKGVHRELKLGASATWWKTSGGSSMTQTSTTTTKTTRRRRKRGGGSEEEVVTGSGKSSGEDEGTFSMDPSPSTEKLPDNIHGAAGGASGKKVCS